MEPASAVIYSLFRGTPQHAEWVVACLDGAWSGILGERLAAYCRPARYRDGTLTVVVTDSAWGDALRDVQHELADRLREATSGEVRGVRIKSPTDEAGC